MENNPKYDGFSGGRDGTMIIRGSFASVLESLLRVDLQVLHDTFLAPSGLKHLSPPVIFKKRSFLTVVHSMKGEEFAPVEHIVQGLQEKTRRLVELAPEIWKVTCSEDNEISARWRLLMVCLFLVGSWDYRRKFRSETSDNMDS